MTFSLVRCSDFVLRGHWFDFVNQDPEDFRVDDQVSDPIYVEVFVISIDEHLLEDLINIDLGLRS